MAGFFALSKQFAGGILRRGLSFINKHPKLQRYVLRITRRLGLHSFAPGIYARLRPKQRNPYGFIPTDITQLSSRARQMHFELKTAVERRRKERD
jgi:hypothetical protein